MKAHPLVVRLAERLQDSDDGLAIGDEALRELADSLAALDGTPALAEALEGILSFASYLGDHHDGPPAAMTLLGLVISAARRMSAGETSLDDLSALATDREKSLAAIGATVDRTPIDDRPAPEGAAKNRPWLRFALDDFEKKRG